MTRKSCRRKVYSVNVDTVAHAISGAAITPSHLLDKLRMVELSAIESFATGRATREDWKALADMANLAEVMAVQFAIEPEAGQASDAAQKALLRAYTRAAEGKSLLMDGPGLQSLRECFAWHDQQRSKVARSVYEAVIKATVAKVKNRAPGVTFIGNSEEAGKHAA